MPGYESISAGLQGYQIRGTKVLVPGYEGIGTGAVQQGQS